MPACCAGFLWDWIAGMVELRRRPGRVERERQGALDGAWQSLRAGVTCVGDISRENVAWEVLKPLPLRKVCYAELLTLADLPPRDPAELRVAVGAMIEDELLTVGVTPHAPYTVPEVQLRAAIALAHELDRPWCTHWAETREEVAFLSNGAAALPAFMRLILDQCDVRSPGLAPGAYLARCTGDRRPGLLAHANYLTPAEAEQVAAAGHVIVYCPRAHRFFGHPAHPFRQFQAAGVTVALGTIVRRATRICPYSRSCASFVRIRPTPRRRTCSCKWRLWTPPRRCGWIRKSGRFKSAKPPIWLRFRVQLLRSPL